MTGRSGAHRSVGPARLRVGLACRPARPPAWVGGWPGHWLRAGRGAGGLRVPRRRVEVLPHHRQARSGRGSVARVPLSDAVLQRIAMPRPAPGRATWSTWLGQASFWREVARRLSVVVNAAAPGVVPAWSRRRARRVVAGPRRRRRGPTFASGYAETLRGATATHVPSLGRVPRRDEVADLLAHARFSTHPLVAGENRLQLLWKSIALVTRDAPAESSAAIVARDERPSPEALPSGATARSRCSSPATRCAPLASCVGASRGVSSGALVLVDASRRGRGRGAAGAYCTMVARGARLVEPPPDRYWADPHLLPGANGRLVLVEEYPYATAGDVSPS